MQPRRGDIEVVTSVAFIPDGKRLACVSEDKTVGPLRGHIEVVTSVAFSPDGKRLACASEDKTVRVWNALTGEEALPQPLRGHT
eukprot:jgi/Tetstr1/446939/TSEL_034397.t1